VTICGKPLTFCFTTKRFGELFSPNEELSPEQRSYFSRIGKKGGKARLTKMTAAQRRKMEAGSWL